MVRNPVLDFEIDKSLIRYVGEGLQRPECILAEPDGTLWAADARGGVAQNRSGRQPADRHPKTFRARLPARTTMRRVI